MNKLPLVLLTAIAFSSTGCDFIFDDGQTDFEAAQSVPFPAVETTPEVPAFQPVRCGWVDGTLTRDNSTGATEGKVLCTNNNATPQSIAITIVACDRGVQKAEGISGGSIAPNGQSEIDFIVLDTEPGWTYFIAEPNGEYCPQV